MLSGLPNVSLPYEFQNFTLLLLTLLRPANVAEEVVLHAFKTGYRHVSGQKMCIATYTESPLHRWIQPERIGTRGPVRMPSEIESSFKQTGLDYIDLYVTPYILWGIYYISKTVADI